MIKDKSCVLDIQALSVSFPGSNRPALEDFTLGVEPGEIIGIIGESGSGKSLAGYSISRLEPSQATLQAKTLSLGGIDMINATANDVIKARREIISYVFQEPMAAFSPNRRLGAQMCDVIIERQNCDKRAAASQVLELLASVDIKSPKDATQKFPFELSGGMLQRALIALAFSGSPKLVIADEITTAIDASSRQTVLALVLEKARASGAAVLFISHDLNVVRAVAPKTIVMYRGRILEKGPTALLTSAPAHPYTESLLASSPERAARRTPLTTVPDIIDTPADKGCNFRPRCPLAEPECSNFQEMEPISETHDIRCWRHS